MSIPYREVVEQDARPPAVPAELASAVCPTCSGWRTSADPVLGNRHQPPRERTHSPGSSARCAARQRGAGGRGCRGRPALVKQVGRVLDVVVLSRAEDVGARRGATGPRSAGPDGVPCRRVARLATSWPCWRQCRALPLSGAGCTRVDRVLAVGTDADSRPSASTWPFVVVAGLRQHRQRCSAVGGAPRRRRVRSQVMHVAAAGLVGAATGWAYGTVLFDGDGRALVAARDRHRDRAGRGDPAGSAADVMSGPSRLLPVVVTGMLVGAVRSVPSAVPWDWCSVSMRHPPTAWFAVLEVGVPAGRARGVLGLVGLVAERVGGGRSPTS